MKKYCLIISFLCVTLGGYSQSFKGVLSLGITGNQIDGDLQGGYRHVGGFALSGVELEKEDLTFSLQGGIVAKGMRNVVLNNTLNLMYLELPVQLKYQISDVTIGGGLYAAYLMRAKLRSGAFKVDKLDLLRKNDIGLLGRVGYQFNESTEVFLRADYSLSSIRADIVNWYNNSLRLGIKIALN